MHALSDHIRHFFAHVPLSLPLDLRNLFLVMGEPTTKELCQLWSYKDLIVHVFDWYLLAPNTLSSSLSWTFASSHFLGSISLVGFPCLGFGDDTSLNLTDCTSAEGSLWCWLVLRFGFGGALSTLWLVESWLMLAVGSTSIGLGPPDASKSSW